MSLEIRDLVPASCALLALGEPTHREPGFGLARNELLARLAGHGFRSIVLETDRVAALAVNEYIHSGHGDRDAFSHDWEKLAPNRRLVDWLRSYNEHRSPADRVNFHGFDTPTENFSAPSPRRYLEFARDHLGLDLDIAALAGDDERWSRPEAVLDWTQSPGATPEAARLRELGDAMLAALDGPSEARTWLTAGLGLLRYHSAAAQPGDRGQRMSRLLGTRDALMAQNLLAVRAEEARRGPTLLFSHNLHLRQVTSTWSDDATDTAWTSAGTIVGALLGDGYVFVPGSLGRADAFGLPDPEPDTYEGTLQPSVATWALMPVPTGRVRTDTTQQMGYFPLDPATLTGAAAVLHVSGRM